MDGELMDVHVRPRHQRKKKGHGIFRSMYQRLEWSVSFSVRGISNAVSQVKQHKFNAAWGFFSIFVVSIIVGLLHSAIQKAPVIYFRFAQADRAEMDALITFVGDGMMENNNRRYNFTKLDEEMKKLGGDFENIAPRNDYNADIWKLESCNERLVYPFTDETGQVIPERLHFLYGINEPGLINCGWQAECIDLMCAAPLNGRYLPIEDDTEEEIGLGVKWPYDPVPDGEAYIGHALATGLNISVGDHIIVKHHPQWHYWSAFQEVFQHMSSVYGWTQDDPWPYHQWRASWVYVPLRVTKILRDTYKKVRVSRTGTIVVANLNSTFDMLGKYMAPHVAKQMRDRFRLVVAREHSNQLVWNLPKETRNDFYVKTNDAEKITNEFITRFSLFSYFVGFDAMDPRFPLLKQLNNIQGLTFALNIVMQVMALALGSVSVLIVYSLLMISADARTFEFGVFRVLGIKRNGLVFMLLMQAAVMAIPATLCALIAGQAVSYGVIMYMFKDYQQKLEFSPWMAPTSMLVSASLGLAIPLISSIFPIMKVLGRSLVESISAARTYFSMKKVSISRAATSFPPHIVVGAILAVIYGFCIYYFYPLSVMAGNFSMMLTMMMLFLLGLLVGLVFLALNFQGVIEVWSLNLFFGWWANRGLRLVTERNLGYNRPRNLKTAVTFASMLCLIIFIAQTAELNLKTMDYSVGSVLGSDMMIQFNWPSQYGSMNRMHDFLTESPFVKTYSVKTLEVNELGMAAVEDTEENETRESYQLKGAQVGTLSGAFQNRVMLVAVSHGFFENLKLLERPVPLDENSFDNGVDKELYTATGSGRLVLGAALTDALKLERNGSCILSVKADSSSNYMNRNRFRMRIGSIFINAFTFFFGQYPAQQYRSNAVISLPAMVRVSPSHITSLDTLPIEYVHIYLDHAYIAKAPAAEFTTFNQRLERMVYQSGGWGSLETLEGAKSGITDAVDAMRMIFSVITASAMFLAYFALAASMYGNVMEQRRVMGVLRSVGHTKRDVLMIFFMEAFTIIVAASFLGAIIGAVAAYIMMMQQRIFTNVPIVFTFPWPIVRTVILSAAGFALVSTWGPVMGSLRKQTSILMRL